MTAKSFWAAFKVQLNKNKTIPLTVISYNITMMLMTGLINFIDTGVFSLDDYGFNRVDIFSALMTGVFAIVYAYDIFNTAAANGISRKTTVIAAAASSLAISFATSLAVSLLIPLTAAITGGYEIWLLELFYGRFWDVQLHGGSEIAHRIGLFFICAFANAAAYMAGFLLTSLYYRMNKICTIVFSLGVGGLIFIGFPAAMVHMEEEGIDIAEVLRSIFIPIMRFFGCAKANGELIGNMAQGVGAFTLLILAMTALSWLAARRSSVKPLAIRNE